MGFGKKLRKFEKGYARRKAVYMPAARQMWRDIKFLKSVINVEKKYSDITFNTTVGTTPNVQTLNALAQGTSAITRTGQSVKFVSNFIRFYITQNGAATTTQVRLIMFMDRQPNSAGPGTTSLLADSTNILSPLQIGNSKRFRVMFDRLIRLDTNKLNAEVKLYRKLRFHTEFNTGNAGTIADITTNSLYVMMIADQNTNQPTISFWSRVRFIDN